MAGNNVQENNHHNDNSHRVPEAPASSQDGHSAACAACKHHRRKCERDCVLLPYFPADRSEDFHSVQKIFGARNVQKTLQACRTHEDKLESSENMIWTANHMIKDPVHGVLGQHRRVVRELELKSQQLDMALRECEKLHKKLLSICQSSLRSQTTALVQYPYRLSVANGNGRWPSSNVSGMGGNVVVDRSLEQFNPTMAGDNQRVHYAQGACGNVNGLSNNVANRSVVQYNSTGAGGEQQPVQYAQGGYNPSYYGNGMNGPGWRG